MVSSTLAPFDFNVVFFVRLPPNKEEHLQPTNFQRKFLNNKKDVEREKKKREWENFVAASKVEDREGQSQMK